MLEGRACNRNSYVGEYDRGMQGSVPPPGAIFLDRDGTLIENRHYLGSPAEVALLPGVREAISRARTNGTKLVLFTNQSGVGRGYLTLADVEAVNRRMIEVIGLGADLFAGICIAPERPDEPAIYRKPAPRFIQEMLEQHALETEQAWMIGDSPSDWEAGINAGIHAAAIVIDAAQETFRERRLQLGIPAYPTLLDWAETVFR